jgi:N-acetylmuramoyl-L-alanine amidase
VIDAGHGGQDPGATGPRGTREKNLVLDYARALKRQLSGRYRVYLTRNDDTFILLRKRIDIARKLKADMFISLHADSDPGHSARGLSVYTLSERASDAEAEQLAARENRVDVVYGLDLTDQSEDVADILISLAQRDTNNRSATLAGLLTDASALDRVKLLENPHRFAGFAVLKSPDIASVLVEIGFLSNAQEEKLLLDKKHRERIVKALSRGIDAYFAARRGSGQ